MNNSRSTSQEEMVVRMVENQMLELATQLQVVCVAVGQPGGLPAETVKRVLVAADESLKDQAKYEEAAGVGHLTPLYFEYADMVNARIEWLRNALADALAKARGA